MSVLKLIKKVILVAMVVSPCVFATDDVKLAADEPTLPLPPLRNMVPRKPVERPGIGDNRPPPRLPSSLRRDDEAPANRTLPPLTPPPSLSKSTPSDKDAARVIPNKCVHPKGKFFWNFDKAKLTDVVAQYSRLACEKYIIASTVKPSTEVTIISPNAVSLAEARQAFLSAIESMELAIVKIGGFNKIIKRVDSIRQAVPLYEKREQIPFDEGVVTYIYEAKHVSKDMAQTLVKSLISRAGDVVSVGDDNLVITDSGTNIQRIMKILSKVDVAGSAYRIRTIDLRHADATQVQQKLNEIFDLKESSRNRRGSSAIERAARVGGDSQEEFSLQKIVVDERTNKLIVIASDKAYDRIKDVVSMLDVSGSDASSRGQINVHYLKHSDAEKMASTLASLTQSANGRQKQASRNRIPPLGGDLEDLAEIFEGDIKVTADPTTNSLVVVASPRDYKALVQVIAKLDKPRIQVYVEAAILDISLSDKNSFGLNAFGFVPTPGLPDSAIVLSNPGGQSLVSSTVKAISAASLAGGATPGLVGAAGLANFINLLGFVGPSTTINLLGQAVQLPSFGAVLNALKTYSNVDILSTPSMMTLDNEKSEMAVGERIPVLKGASTIGLGTGAGGIGIPLQNVEYQDVKLKFAFTPHVNDNNEVRMEIEQDVNELGEQEQILGSTQYRIRNKSAKTTVMARDQQSIVIGGLIDQKSGVSESKVPILGDIPIIGWFFKTQERTKGKRNLLLVVTPYVIRGEEDFKKILERKMLEREEFARTQLGQKAQAYNPHVDYDKKVGPMGQTVRYVEDELQRGENGGAGSPGETIINPMEMPAKKEDPVVDIEAPEDIPDVPESPAKPPPAVLIPATPTPPVPPPAEGAAGGQ